MENIISNEFKDRHMEFIEKLYGIEPGDYWKQDIPSTLDHEILRDFSKDLISNTSEVGAISMFNMGVHRIPALSRLHL
jgi:hypothetical protein